MILWLSFSALLAVATAQVEADPNGYILYCPCMGRFGNQADHFLGALAFAKGLDRTLVLPPWVEYHAHSIKSVQVPFKTYFKVEPLQEYHRVMTMEIFMKELAPQVWKPEDRTVFCYRGRNGQKENDCNAKDGNPFGPFWDTFDIDFTNNVFYEPLHYDSRSGSEMQRWKETYPSKEFYVLAFTGAPAAFPARESDAMLQRYLKWSDAVETKVKEFISQNFAQGPWLGIHLRNGEDWANVCTHVGDGQRHLFGSPLCLGYRMEHGVVTTELCNPPENMIIKNVVRLCKEHGIKGVFVATDNNPMIETLGRHLQNKIPVLQFSPSHPHVDLALLGRADYFIGNCISTFSSFAVRERNTKRMPVEFWAFPAKDHDEL